MKNHVIFFSGGIASFEVAHFVKQKYPHDNILLYFTDTLWEDEDLYRFIYEASDKLELPMLYHCFGMNPIQLMHKQVVVFNSMIGNCSTILKTGVAADFFFRGIEPQLTQWHNIEYLKQIVEPLEKNFKENTTLYFGIGWEEEHRQAAINKNWRPFHVEMPLIDEYIEKGKALEIYNIELPRLYKLGFTHNNCKGRCVKAGQGHNINLLQQLPEVFKKAMALEYHMSNYVSTYHYFKNQKYVPEHERFDEDTLEILLKELNDAYEDYFWDRAPKPKVYVHPSFVAVPYETDLLQIEYSFVREVQKKINGDIEVKWKRSKPMKTFNKNIGKSKNKWFFKAQEGLKLIETRHCKPKIYSYMKRRKNGISKPYPLRNLYWDAVSEGLHQKPKNVIVQRQHSKQLDLFDIGGCGCDFSQTDESACSVLEKLNKKKSSRRRNVEMEH